MFSLSNDITLCNFNVVCYVSEVLVGPRRAVTGNSGLKGLVMHNFVVLMRYYEIGDGTTVLLVFEALLK